MSIVIYHNPKCGTSRNTLAMIRQSGEEPEVVEYLKSPPSRERLAQLIRLMSIRPRDLLRRKGTPYEELGLDDPKLSDDQIIDFMIAHPILINRPIVVTSKGGTAVPSVRGRARHSAQPQHRSVYQRRRRGHHRREGNSACLNSICHFQT